MKRPIKAALLSAFACPGAGHFFLKKNRLGTVYLCSFILPFFFVIMELTQKVQHAAEQVSEQIMSGELPLDAQVLTEKISELATIDNSSSLNFKIYFLFAVWLAAIVDSYRLGH